MVGKSSVLRELCQRKTVGEDFVLLFVEAEAGRGICGSVADVLAAELGWPLSDEEARDWMRNLARAGARAWCFASMAKAAQHTG